MDDDLDFKVFEEASEEEEVDTDIDGTLIQLIEHFPNLIDKSNADYKNNQVREQSWFKIAFILNLSVEECQRNWERLRRRYVTERNYIKAPVKSGSSYKHKEKWSYHDAMMFMEPLIARRKTTSYVKNTEPTSQPGTSKTISIPGRPPQSYSNTSSCTSSPASNITYSLSGSSSPAGSFGSGSKAP